MTLHADRPEWRAGTFVAAGVAAGLTAGLLAAVSRIALQEAGGTDFEMRLTALSWRMAWVAPLVYAGLFGLFALCWSGFRIGIGRARARTTAIFSLSVLVFLEPLAASGRLAPIAAVLLSLGLAATVVRTLPRAPAAQARIVRRVLPWFAAAVVGVFGVVEAGQRLSERIQLARLPAADPEAPNILVIVLDTLRADHVSSYGYHRDTTPALSQVARDGVQFSYAIASSSWTLPTHVSLLTGHYPALHGANMDRFDNRVPTLGAALAERGYRTAAISANTVVFSRAQGFGREFLHFDDAFYSVQDAFFRLYYPQQAHKRILVPYLGWRRETSRRSAENVTTSALDWIGQGRPRPFFLVLNYFDTHDPYLPPQPWRSRFSAKDEPGGRLAPSRGPEDRFTAEEIQDEVDAYDGAIAYADHQIGRLLAELDRRGLRDRTAVIVTSDHGESFGQHGLMWHGTSLYIEQIRVPLLMQLPNRIPAGVLVNTPVSHTSIPATVVELAGGRGAIAFPGQSLSPLWSPDPAASPWPPPVSELIWVPFVGSATRGCGTVRSVVSGQYHFIEHAACEAELYDLTRDPEETNNLAGHTDNRGIVEQLRIELNRQVRPGS